MKKNVKKSLLALSIATFVLAPMNLVHAKSYKTTKYYPTTKNIYKINNNQYYQQQNCWNNFLITYVPTYRYNCNYTQNVNNNANNTQQNQTTTQDVNNNTNNAQQNQTITQKEAEPNTSTSVKTEELEVVRLVNIERQKAGLSPLTHNEELSKVARVKSQDMADNNYFSHNSPTYNDPFTMMKNFGISYRQAGENIAKGYNSPESVVNGWMNSPGHRANILNPNFNKIGVGYVNKGGSTYWTQMFTD